jgi:hypothetical protein
MQVDGIFSSTFGGELNVELDNNKVSYSIVKTNLRKNSYGFNELHVPLSGM